MKVIRIWGCLKLFARTNNNKIKKINNNNKDQSYIKLYTTKYVAEILDNNAGYRT